LNFLWGGTSFYVFPRALALPRPIATTAKANCHTLRDHISGRPWLVLGIATSKLLFVCERIVLFDNDAAQMTASNPRAGWEKVGDQFYRKIQLYESVFDPDLELENYFVAGAPYGGAIGSGRQ
jgi:hypothetical protein